MDVHRLSTRSSRTTTEADQVAHHEAQKVVLMLFLGTQIRNVPRSRCVMDLVVHRNGAEHGVGLYTLNHTPWSELSASR